MKKYILLLIFATCSTLLSAQSSSDEYKYQMIKNINKGSFNKATKLIEKVSDWTFDSEDEKAWLDLNQAISFAGYIDSVQIVKKLQDSLMLYIGKETSIYTAYYSNNGYYDLAIQFCELEEAIYRKLYDTQHPMYLSILDNLGALYGTIGVLHHNSSTYKEAENYYLKALTIARQNFGKRDLRYATILNNLGIFISVH